MLKKEQQLKVSQSKQIEQQLKLAKQQALALKKENELQKQREEIKQQRLLAEKAELERQQKEQELLAAENEKAAQAKQLNQEQSLRKYGYGIIILTGIVLGLVVWGLLVTLRSRKALQSQSLDIKQKSEEILVQNEELMQSQEELQAQRDFVNEQNMALEQKNNQINLKNGELQIAQENLIQSKKVLEATFDELKAKNGKLTDSIKYAKRMQTAFLPPESNIQAVFQEHFIIYRPKDMVSGDFYWFSQQNNKSIIAVVDCTGHGVPGAFMSLIGNTHLNHLVNEKGIYDPAKILENLHYGVTDSLNQKDSKNVDGMDLAIVCIEKNKKSINMVYSGAKCPIFHCRNGKVTKMASNRKSIGGWSGSENITYTNRKITLEKGDLLYLTTDGFIDSANQERIRLGSKKFKEIIVNHGHKSIHEQKIIFENILITHQQGTEQRDDITLMGLKI